MMKTEPNLASWVPEAIYAEDGGIKVKWCHIGRQRFIHPFFHQTIRHCRMKLCQSVSPLQTPFDFLLKQSSKQVGLSPSGFIFHMSRCGSTLLAQVLATIPKNIVIAEAPAIDAILRVQVKGRPISDMRRIGWLQSVVNTLCQKRHPAEENVAIKWDSWHTLQIPLIQAAFPEVPWIFLYRDPVEVMVSHIKMRGLHMVPGLLEGDPFGLGATPLCRMGLDEFGARVLSMICQAAVKYRRYGNGWLVNYAQLSDNFLPRLYDFFGMTFSAAEQVQMGERMLFDAKRPYIRFETDSSEKQKSASPEILKLVHQWLAPVYAQMESVRFE